jgi:hypothetical protein
MLSILKPLFFGFGISLLGLEILLHLLPVANGTSFRSNNIDRPVLTIDTKTIIHSLGWKMEQAQTRRVNNLGFIDDRDYHPNTSPVAVIGDSYIKSAMLPYKSTLQNYLAQKLTGKTPVYSYGIPSYAFSGYIGTAEYVSRTFKPQAFVFLLTHGDIEDSFQTVKGSYALDRTDRQLQFTDAKHSKLLKLIKNSSLLRYLTSHLGIVPNRSMNMVETQSDSAKLSDRELKEISSQLLNYLTQKSTVNPQNTILILDSDREVIYGQKSVRNYRDLAIFKQVAQAQGYQIIDTYPLFDRYYKATHQRLDFTPLDPHWNATAHALVAQEVFPFLSTILTRQQQ